MPGAVRLQGDLQVDALQKSFFALLQRQEILRTTIHEQDGQPLQRIAARPTFGFPLLDLSTLSPHRREEDLQRLVQQEGHVPFELARGPLYRAWLIKLAGQDYVLLLSLHHIISDGWSINLLVRELTSLYRAFVKGEPSPLAPLPIQYADYAHWQQQWLQGEVLREHLRYWTEQLSEARALDLPTDIPRPSRRSQQGAHSSRQLDTELMQKLMLLSRQEGMTLFMTALAAFQVLLYRLSGQTDVLVGTDSANRGHVETEGLIGFFINVLALRTRLEGNPQFQQVLRQVREMVLAAYMHQELPFEMVVEHLRLEREEGQRTPLINVLFVMQNVPTVEGELPGVTVRSLNRGTGTTRFDLALFLFENLDGLRCSINYSTDLFEEATIAKMLSYYEAILRAIVAHPDAPIDSLEIQPSVEQEEMERSEQRGRVARKDKLKKVDRTGIELT